jgi:hypothetical protein
MERRGLLQYDRHVDRYDLHPVVRGYASGSLRDEDRDRFGQRAVDYFSQQPQDPFKRAETLDDVRNGLLLVRILLQIGRKQEAFVAYKGELSQALTFNLEASAEVVSLLRPFFTQDWTSPSAGINDRNFSYLATDAAIAFSNLGQLGQSLAVHEAALKVDLKGGYSKYLLNDLEHVAGIFARQNRLARYDKCLLLALELSELIGQEELLFLARLHRFQQLSMIGQWVDAKAVWQALDPMGRHWSRILYRPGEAEEVYARSQFWQRRLTEDLLTHAEDLASSGRNRPSIRSLYALRGEWQLERHEWAPAVESLQEAIRMTREAGQNDTQLETQLALAQLQLGRLPAAHQEATSLSNRRDPAHLALAELWYAMGESGRAAEHALAAYLWAWADGEPHVHRYELARSTALLNLLNTKTPRLPVFDPADGQQLAYENQIRAAIRKLRAERTASRRKRKQG